MNTAIESAALPVVVQKYGGSSLADVDKLGRVAERVVATRRAGHHVVVVVSAMGKTTDELLALARQVARHGRPEVEPPRRELDMLVSTGERVAMALLSIAIQARGLDAISFTGSQCGIITNDRHFDARIIEVRPARIEDELARGRVVIVAGYQGMSYKREITTLGRGGSDTTAVALAAALEAERCEIYSDVDGVYSADPRAVPAAQHLPELDYQTLQEMAEAGAKVVCAQAVEWARRAGIALYARSTFSPTEGGARETLVRKFGPSEQPRARAIVTDQPVALARFGHGAGSAELERVVSSLCGHGVGIRQLEAARDRASLVLSVGKAPKWQTARAELCELVPSVAIVEPLGLVSVVGGGLADTPQPLLQLRRILAEMGARPHALSVTALRLGAVVEAEHALAAQQRLHEAFVDP